MKQKINKKLFEKSFIYEGKIQMPKGFDIKTENIVKHIKEINFNKNYNNWFCKETAIAETFILDYLRSEHKLPIETSDSNENIIFKENEISKIKLEQSNCDLVCLYGVDIYINSCSLFIYSNTTKDKYEFKLEKDFFIIFPSHLKYNIENKNNVENNYMQKFFYIKL